MCIDSCQILGAYGFSCKLTRISDRALVEVLVSQLLYM
nr:MAG TPA: hypothetical protein [Caudoviricetes sp.]